MEAGEEFLCETIRLFPNQVYGCISLGVLLHTGQTL